MGFAPARARYQAFTVGIANNKRTELENKLNNQPSISAPNRNESEKIVKAITGAVESATGTSDPFAGSEIGKQLNRLGVSTLRLTGKAMELSNYFSEKLNDAVRSVAPDSVDELLNQADKTNRENAQALQNTSSAVTNEDTFIDAKARQSGREVPFTEDSANKLMYFPEAIPNAIDSAVKGDFKDDDGSDYITIKEINLKDVLGANYKENVFGKTRLGSRNNPTGTAITDFTDGTLTAKFKKDTSGEWKLDTMFPEPKP